MMRRRWRTAPCGRLLALMVALTALGIAPGAAAHVRSPEGAVVRARACPSGSVAATIGGLHRCLTPGQRCQKRLDPQYHRYGFHCHSGTLVRRKPAVPALPAAGKVVATIAVPSSPMGVIDVAGAIWVANHRSGDIARIDPATNKVVARLKIPTRDGQPARFATGAEGFWHVDYSDNVIEEIDPATNRIVAQVSTPEQNCCVPAVGAGAVWVPKPDIGVVDRIDARSRNLVAQIKLDRFFGVYFAFGSLWATTGGDVVRIDPATNGIAARIPVAGLTDVNFDSNCCPWMAVGGNALWVSVGKSVVRIDPATNRVAATVPTPGTATYIAATDTAVWVVGDANFPTYLWRIDPGTNNVIGSVLLARASQPGDIAVGEGAVWVTLFSSDKVLRIQPSP